VRSAGGIERNVAELLVGPILNRFEQPQRDGIPNLDFPVILGSPRACAADNDDPGLDRRSIMYGRS
jgi:hypothetical protein